MAVATHPDSFLSVPPQPRTTGGSREMYFILPRTSTSPIVIGWPMPARQGVAVVVDGPNGWGGLPGGSSGFVVQIQSQQFANDLRILNQRASRRQARGPNGVHVRSQGTLQPVCVRGLIHPRVDVEGFLREPTAHGLDLTVARPRVEQGAGQVDPRAVPAVLFHLRRWHERYLHVNPLY